MIASDATAMIISLGLTKTMTASDVAVTSATEKNFLISVHTEQVNTSTSCVGCLIEFLPQFSNGDGITLACYPLHMLSDDWHDRGCRW